MIQYLHHAFNICTATVCTSAHSPHRAHEKCNICTNDSIFTAPHAIHCAAAHTLPLFLKMLYFSCLQHRFRTCRIMEEQRCWSPLLGSFPIKSCQKHIAQMRIRDVTRTFGGTPYFHQPPYPPQESQNLRQRPKALPLSILRGCGRGRERNHCDGDFLRSPLSPPSLGSLCLAFVLAAAVSSSLRLLPFFAVLYCSF